MKLSSILAAAAVLAAPGLAAAQAHGGPGMAGGGRHLGSLPGAAGAHHPIVAGGALGGGRFDHHPGFHDRFHHHRDFLVGGYPYWGWSYCGVDWGCDWSSEDPPGPTPADYADPPPAPGYAAAQPAARHADLNECSDWVWRAKLHRSVCKRAYRG